jgi:hypothetical protein
MTAQLLSGRVQISTWHLGYSTVILACEFACTPHCAVGCVKMGDGTTAFAESPGIGFGRHLLDE